MNTISYTVKIGGSFMCDPCFAFFVADLSQFLKDYTVIIVHGGGPLISSMEKKLDLKTTFIDGYRYTDKETIQVVDMVLSGTVNGMLTSILRKNGLKVIGLSRSSGLHQSKQIERLGYVGEPEKLSSDMIFTLLQHNYLPVFSSVSNDFRGEPLNVNADVLSAYMATQLCSENLILFTDVAGLLDTNHQTVPYLYYDGDRDKIFGEYSISGGMIPKLNAVFSYLDQGGKSAWIFKGCHPLKDTKGTLITKEKVLFDNSFFPF